MDNRIRNNGTRNKNIDIVSAHRTMRDKERDHETLRKRTKSWYVTIRSKPTLATFSVGRQASIMSRLAAMGRKKGKEKKERSLPRVAFLILLTRLKDAFT